MILNFILPFVIVLVVLVIVHELGHFVTAKLAGVKVLEFGIGYPPRLFAKRFGETEYSINILPLGGFVRLLGEEDPSAPRSLASKPRPVRLLVLASGSLMNFILPFILFTIAFMIPREVAVGLTQIVFVMPGSPAAEAGLQPGDVIFAVNGREVRNPAELGFNIRLHMGDTITLRVKRADPQTGAQEFHDVPVQVRWAPPDIVHIVQPGETASDVANQLGVPVSLVRNAAGIEYVIEEGKTLTIPKDGEQITYVAQRGDTALEVARRLGVSEEAVRAAAGLPDPEALTPGQELHISQGPTGIIISPLYPFTESEAHNFFTAFRLGARNVFETLTLTRNEIISWIKGGTTPQVAGPVGLAQAAGEVVEQAGWEQLLGFAAILSINLAIINMLPLPMLDGGRAMFVVLEILRGGKRISPERENLVHLIGFALLISLVIVITYFDISRILEGGSLFR